MDDQTYTISKLNKYVFEFPSIGKKHMVKQVRFTKMENDNDIYNLALGTVLKNGKVDFLDSSNNGDVVKVFATVAKCIKTFADDFPDKIIFFKGNTEQKTKVYNEILKRHYDEFSLIFNIFGMDTDGFVHQFEIGKNYSGFLLKRKVKQMI